MAGNMKNEQKMYVLIQARVRQGWAQADLAEKMGVAAKTVARWEAGTTIPQPGLRAKLGALLQIDPEEIWPFQATLPDPVSKLSQRFDWGEAPHMDQLYGRDQELATLKHWMIDDSCRVVAILGMGGIGKTSLAATIADQLLEYYDCIFWRSLHNAPPFRHLLQTCIQFVSPQQQTALPEEVESQISLLIESFRVRRCLLVLDNVESILQAGSQTGQYREGYEGYGRLFQRIGESKHRSCLLVTSREKPPEVALLEGKAAVTRSYHLVGLSLLAGQDILKDKGLEGTESIWEALITTYSGNPLALKLVAQVIREVFSGEITAFLKDGEVFFRDVRDILEQQMGRLSPSEEEIVYWLAIQREAVALPNLQEYLVQPMSKGELQEVLRSLRRRHLVETSTAGFTLHPVTLEYLTDRFVERVCEEIKTGRFLLFEQHPLLLAQAKEYIRDGQCRLILLPLLHRLLALFGEKAVLEQRFQNLLATLHEQADQNPGYAAGNILNLLIQMGCTLRGYDLSHLVVRQAYLKGVDLPEVNFAHANLITSTFTDTFGGVLSVAFGSQGDLLAAGTTTGEIRIWHTTSGRPLQTLQGHTDSVRSVAFSPDGEILASGSYDQTVRLWEVNSGKLLSILQGHTNGIRSVAFSPDGETLASGSYDQTVRLWEASSGKLLFILQGHNDAVRSVTFSPDGKMLASGSRDRRVRLWKASSGELFSILQGHTHVVRSVAFSPDGKTLASGSDDQTVRLWEVNSGHCFLTLQGHSNMVRSVAFSPDGETLASGSDDQTVRLWEVNSGHCFLTLQGHSNMVRSVAFSPDGRILASGSYDQTVRLWEVSSGKLLSILQGHNNTVTSVSFRPNGGTLTSGSYDRTVRLWEASSGKLLSILQGHTDAVLSVAFSPDGEILASGSDDRTVRLWEVSSGKLLSILQGHTYAVLSVAFSPDGEILASGSYDQTVRLWEVNSGKLLSILQGHTDSVLSVAFSPDGKTLASGSYDQTVRLWEVSSGKLLSILQGHNSTVRSVAFSPDGKTLASGSNDQVVRLWEASSGKLLSALQGHSNAVLSVTFSPDGKTLASGSYDQTVRLWEVSSGQCLNILSGHNHWISSVTFSPDGMIIASSSHDGTINLWERQTGACLRVLRNDRPYERMNITQVQGLTEGQKAALRSLGAIENE